MIFGRCWHSFVPNTAATPRTSSVLLRKRVESSLVDSSDDRARGRAGLRSVQIEVKWSRRRSLGSSAASPSHVKTPGARSGRCEKQKNETIQDGEFALVQRRREEVSLWDMRDEIGCRHFA